MNKKINLKISGGKSCVVEFEVAYKIMQPDGTFKKVYETKYHPETKINLIIGSKDFVCSAEDKTKILLIKGCYWVPIKIEARNALDEVSSPKLR